MTDFYGYYIDMIWFDRYYTEESRQRFCACLRRTVERPLRRALPIERKIRRCAITERR